jgi:hypothetical protein
VANEPEKKSGVARSLFKGEWPWLPDFRTLTPDAKTVSQTVTLPAQIGDKPFGVAFEGFLQIPADGDYIFSVDADGGAMFFVHDIRVIDEPRNPADGEVTGRVRLKAGWHPVRLYYRHISGEARLAFAAKSADGQPLKMDASKLRQITSSLGSTEPYGK